MANVKIENLIREAREEYDGLSFEEEATLRILLSMTPDNYWVIVDQIPIPSLKAIYNYRHGVMKEGFISKKCGRVYRKVTRCKDCLHFFECLDHGESVILKAKGEKNDE